MKRNGKVFIDANILIYAESYQHADVFKWINALYEEIYIHKIVLDELILGTVRQKVEAFRELDEKKKQEDRPLKNTNDLGEMHCLAAAMLLSASIICSNDYDISEIIEDTPLMITLNEEEASVLIQQDTLEDFCYYVIAYGIEKRSTVRKFFKLIQRDRLDQLDKRIQSLKG